MRDRKAEIKAKGFNIVAGRQDIQNTTFGYQPINQNLPIDYNKIKVGAKVIDDAVFQLGSLYEANPRLADKQTVLKAIDNNDIQTMREISDFFYRTSGIYSRILRYMAFMYRYDWYVTPYVNDDKTKKEKLLADFHKCLSRLDNFGVKKTLGEIALKVLRYGCYYGYKVKVGDSFVLQELDSNYCRSRFNCGQHPVVEFNMKYFDDKFRDVNQRIAIIKMFPDEFAKGYSLYKQGKLPAAFAGDTAGWYVLDYRNTVKFNANGEDYPMFMSVIPLIIDLDEAQGLDRKKTQQRLLKILIQKMPLDKNGELIFDVEEAQQLHNNAVQMLSRAIGVDVLTTFADIQVEDLADNAATTQTDDLQRVERQVFNEAGVSQMQFNTDGNIALEKSILNDEASMYNLVLQFEVFLNDICDDFNSKRVTYRAQILTTTIYNYKEMSKLYKEQMQVGFSKMLPQIALGHSQSSLLATAYFENDILDLVDVFIPPLMSSTMNENILNRSRNNGSGEDKSAGRPEKADDEKSTKTLQNKESMS